MLIRSKQKKGRRDVLYAGASFLYLGVLDLNSMYRCFHAVVRK
ncbi:hypothetical protein HMPREF0083_00716 [Aneurinibacillus aneurinilyticus ATCC 12856]|uniref:Uncharacterized protein n=1 Tax=Aneurinibacillus aneurinilyticus ATCC 12856 TaxID=649747 RepID=U1X9D9_ANEAE|nr:hypothetical protein HMPREF0083_00716 [Aneurinibacillus aneurinilyticus ATCC 12856]